MKKRNSVVSDAASTHKLSLKERFQNAVQTAKQEVSTVLREDRRTILYWSLAYLILAIGSLFLTSLTKGNGWSDFPVVFFNLLPRMTSLFLLTLPAFLCPYRKTAYAFLATIWGLWITLSLANIPLWSVFLLIGFGLACVVACFFWEKRKPSSYGHRLFFRQVLIWSYSFFALLLLAEIIHQHHVFSPFRNAFYNPDSLSVNFLVVFGLGSFIFWIPRRKVGFALYSAIWLVLSYTSFLKYKNVNEPVSILDVFQIREALAVLSFLSIAEILLYVFLAVLLIVLLVILIRKEKKHPVHLVHLVGSFISFLVISIMLLGCSLYVPSYQDADGKLVKSIFFQRGFPYSFMNFSIRSQLDQPGENASLLTEIWDQVRENFTSVESERKDIQNLIIIQVESFADPYLFPGAQYEQDPLPFIHSLMENYTSGSVHVPVFGGQTVKSEFETLTGMNIDLLSFGTNPYVKIINKKPVDSYVRYLHSQGYTTTAIHNYQGEFFDRNIVYQNLGFDRFISYEFMPNVEKREGDIWANDAVLVEEIQKVLDAGNGEKQFVFTVSVQLHGDYNALEKEDYPMEISGFADESLEARVAYYVSQMVQVDAAIQQLITYLESRNEPTYVAFYSDHLPSLFSDVPEYTDDMKYTTSFFTWNNMGIEKDEDQEFELYYLTNYINSVLGFDGTFMNKFHSVFHDQPKYMEYYKTVQYYTLNSELEESATLRQEYEVDFPNTNYSFGIVPLGITSITQDLSSDSTRYIVKGTGLTKDTYLCVNGRIYSLILEDENTAYLEDFDRTLDGNTQITLRVVGEKYGKVFVESKNYVYLPSGDLLPSPSPESD